MDYTELLNKIVIGFISILAGLITYFLVYEGVGIVLNGIILIIEGKIIEGIKFLF